MSRRAKEIEAVCKYARTVENEGRCPHCGGPSRVASHVYPRGSYAEFAAVPSNVFGLCIEADRNFESGFEKLSVENRIAWLRDPRNILEEFQSWVNRKLDTLELVVQEYRRANSAE